jgi:hypothetical protein
MTRLFERKPSVDDEAPPRSNDGENEQQEDDKD